MRNCACPEGRTFRTIGRDEAGHRIYAEIETPTDLDAHDCEYIARRNREFEGSRNAVRKNRSAKS